MRAKTLVVVGAGPGLGLAVARRFGREGFRVALIGRNASRLAELTEILRRAGTQAAAFPADVTDIPALLAALDSVKPRFGDVDVLEYSPIAPPRDPAALGALALTAETAAAAINLIALGAIASAQHLLPDMMRRRSGTILITTGGSAIQRQPFLCGFAVAGGAARNYALTLNAALGGSGVFAASVCIGLGITAGDPQGDPDVLAETYYRLHIERDRSEVQILATSPEVDRREFGRSAEPNPGLA